MKNVKKTKAQKRNAGRPVDQQQQAVKLQQKVFSVAHKGLSFNFSVLLINGQESLYETDDFKAFDKATAKIIEKKLDAQIAKFLGFEKMNLIEVLN
jgi:hypothetical protein